MPDKSAPANRNDAFRQRIAAADGGAERPLKHQSRGRPLNDDESALADALMAIYGEGAQDFDAVAKALTARGVRAPASGRTDWDAALMEAELKALNADLDAAYREAGYGA